MCYTRGLSHPSQFDVFSCSKKSVTLACFSFFCALEITTRITTNLASGGLWFFFSPSSLTLLHSTSIHNSCHWKNFHFFFSPLTLSLSMCCYTRGLSHPLQFDVFSCSKKSVNLAFLLFFCALEITTRINTILASGGLFFFHHLHSHCYTRSSSIACLVSRSTRIGIGAWFFFLRIWDSTRKKI